MIGSLNLLNTLIGCNKYIKIQDLDTFIVSCRILIVFYTCSTIQRCQSCICPKDNDESRDKGHR
jgi:hypothetical protein